MVAAAPRPRVRELMRAAEVLALVGHAGAGKTTAVRAALTAHDGPCLHLCAATAGTTDLRAAIERAQPRPESTTTRPTLLAVDSLEHAAPAAVEAVVTLVDGWSEPHRLLLAGRRLPPQVSAAIERRQGRTITADELRFDEDELRAVLGAMVTARLDDAELRMLRDRCAGWPAAIEATAARLRAASNADDEAWDTLVGELIVAPVALRSLVDDLLDAAPSETIRHALVQLAGLPAFDDVLCAQLGLAGGVDDVLDLGLPVEPAGTGFGHLPAALSTLLAPRRLDPALASRAADHLIKLDRVAAALEVLAATDAHDALARTLADLPASSIGRLDPGRHAAAVGALPAPLLAARPRILLHLADSFIVAGRPEDYRHTIERARRLVDDAPDTTPTPTRLEVLAADLSMRAVARTDDSLVAEATALLADPSLGPMGRARLLGGTGRAAASALTPAALRGGARQLAHSAQLFEQTGAEIHAAASLVVAATHANWPLGRYRIALEQLDRALQHTLDNPRARIAVLPYRAFVLIDLGRYAEAEADLAELRRTAHGADATGNERAAAFARWGAAKMSSQRGDGAATWAACHAVARSEAMVDTRNGATFRAEAAQLLARVGRTQDARDLLDQARLRDQRGSPPVELATFVLAAYSGDRDTAETVLRRLESHATIEPRERWRITLLHAYVRHLDGADDVDALASAAFEEAAQLGHPELPTVREAEVTRVLLELGSAHSASARELTRPDDVMIEVFGGLRIHRSGTTRRPRGRTSELLALLALHDREVTVDRAIDELWADVDTRRGRQRLRTVLHRVRRDCGALIERQGNVLRLHDDVRIDVERFLELTDRAQSTSPRSQPAATAASAAIALHTADAVPEFADRSWATAARQELRLRLLAMHELVAAAAEAGGRLDEAIRAAETAIALDETVEHHHLTVARLRAELGRHRPALQQLADARTALSAHGLTPSAELGRLEAYLRRVSRTGAEVS